MSPPVVVIGMHRAGSTLLAEGLAELGVFLGHRLDAHHEARFFRRLNDWALRQAGGSWDRPTPFDALGEFQLSNIERVFRRHLRGLRRLEWLGPSGLFRRGCVGCWGWKDPRNTFLIDLWMRIFPDLRVIRIHRHPLDVAISLLARERRLEAQFEPGREIDWHELMLTGRPLYGLSGRIREIDDGLELWHEYVHRAESLPRRVECHDVRFEQLVTDPYGTLRSVADFIGVRPESGIIEKFADRVDPRRANAHKESPLLRRFARQQLTPTMSRLGYDLPA